MKRPADVEEAVSKIMDELQQPAISTGGRQPTKAPAATGGADLEALLHRTAEHFARQSSEAQLCQLMHRFRALHRRRPWRKSWLHWRPSWREQAGHLLLQGCWQETAQEFALVPYMPRQEFIVRAVPQMKEEGESGEEWEGKRGE